VASRAAPPLVDSRPDVPDVSLLTLEPLATPELQRSYAGPVALPDDIVDLKVGAPTRTVDPQDLVALERARQAFKRIVERARRAHQEQQALLEATAGSALERHRLIQERLQARVADVGSELDASLERACAAVDLTVDEGVRGLEESIEHAQRLVARTAAQARHRIAANANTAGAQVTAIINQLAGMYTDTLEGTAADITATGIRAAGAVRAFGATAPTLYPGGDDPVAEAMNEGRREEAAEGAKRTAPQVERSASAQAGQYREQIPAVRRQFDQSQLGRAINAHKDQIRSEGRRAVHRAVRIALSTLRQQADRARVALREMAADAKASLAAERRAAQARMLGEANALLVAEHAETRAELRGLTSAQTAGLPAFDNLAAGLENGLRRAGEGGAQSLSRAAAAGAVDATRRLDDLAGTQRRTIVSSDQTSQASIATAEAAAGSAMDRIRNTADTSLQAGTARSQVAMRDFAHSHGSSFSSVAQGVSRAAEAWAMPLAEYFASAIAATRRQQIEATGPGSYQEWAGQVQQQKRDFLDHTIDPYLTPETGLRPVIEGAAEQVRSDLNTRQARLVAALDYGIIDTVDESGATGALRGLTATQGRALEWDFNKTHRLTASERQALQFMFPNEQRFDLQWRLESKLDGDDLTAARAYLAGDTAAGAAAELRASIHWYNDEESRIEAIMRDLKPEELAELKRSKDGSEALAYVRDHLGGTDLNVFDALSEGNHDRADAYRMRDRLKEARQSADIDAVHTVLAEYGRSTTERGRVYQGVDEHERAAERRTGVQREFAYIQAGHDATGKPSEVSAEQAASAVEDFALAPLTVMQPGPTGEFQLVQVKVSGANRDLASALIREGEDSVAARAARLGVEVQRPGGPKMLNLDSALVDPRLNPNNPVPAPEREQARRDRDAVFQRFAKDYGGGEQAATAAAARAFAEGQLRRSFGSDQLSADLAVNLAREEHPSPATAAMAIRLASRGVGTHEELMWRFVERMNRDEINQMRKEYKAQTKSSLDADLGTFGHKGWFTELSGDDRLRMERALLGQPRNDRERAEVAAFAAQQQRDETGFLGSWLASGSMQDKALTAASARLSTALGGATVRVDEHGNPIWTDRHETKLDPDEAGGAAFDKAGKYLGAGAQRDEFLSAVQMTSLAAENYAAKVDSYANFLATTVAVIGAVAAAVATVATGGAASPLLMAAIAGVTGLTSMAVRASVSGGRYGWEQAATDLGMTAVQALTAGVGQHLAILSRGGTQGLMAGMTTLRNAQGLARSMGAITGSTLGDVLLLGAVTGAMGGLGTTALSEATWSKGIGAGLGELFEGILTGAFSGLATSAVSNAFEALPVGRTAAGVRRSLGDVIGESRNPAVRGVLRGASSSLGAASGRGVELGIGSVTGRYKGDAGDIVTSMGEAGALAAVQDTIGGAVEAPIHAAQQAREQRRAAAPSARPEGEPTPRPGGPPTPPLSELAPPTTPPPTGYELPARPPGAEREAPAPPAGPAPTEELRPPVGAPTAGTAAAVGERFRGDMAKPTSNAKKKIQEGVDEALSRLVGDQGIFREGSHGLVRTEDGERRELSIQGRSGEHIEVHVVVSQTMAEGVPAGEMVPVARFQREPGAKAFVIEVSAGAHPRTVERALAHELAEITALHAGRQDSADALAPGATAKSLSPHDEGRLAEFEVLARQLEQARSKPNAKDVARLQDDAEQLVAHLGLTGESDATQARVALALRNLPEDSPGRQLLAQAITQAGENPFLQRTTGDYETDLSILARRLEKARAMGDAALARRVIAEARLLLLPSEAIKQERREAFLRSLEAIAESEATRGIEDDLASLGMSMIERNVRKQKMAKDEEPDPLWKLAQTDTGPALEAGFGPGWEEGELFRPLGAAKGEMLGSTVPDWFHPDDNIAVEVKRFNLLEAGIDPAHPGGVGTPSPRTVEAFQRAHQQAHTRRWVIPTRPDLEPVQRWMVFDIRGQGVTDVAAVGAGLQTLLNRFRVPYERLMVLTNDGLVNVP
jgi:hypothetical protein